LSPEELLPGYAPSDHEYVEPESDDADIGPPRCAMCGTAKLKIEAMNVPLLMRYVSPVGDILPRKITGNCARHQRAIARTFRRAKHMGLLSYKRGFDFHSPYEPPEDLEEDFDREEEERTTEEIKQNEQARAARVERKARAEDKKAVNAAEVASWAMFVPLRGGFHCLCLLEVL